MTLIQTDGIYDAFRFILVPHMLYNDTLLHPALIKTIAVFHDLCINVNSFNQMALTVECALLSFVPSVYASFTTRGYWSLMTLAFPVSSNDHNGGDDIPLVVCHVLQLHAGASRYVCSAVLAWHDFARYH